MGNRPPKRHKDRFWREAASRNEFDGSVRRALSVVKKRSGNHEHTIREFKLSHQGITVGPPLKGFSGIFSGTPVYKGEEAPLMSRDTDGRG